MKKAIKYSLFALLSVALIMALTNTFTLTTGDTAHDGNTAVSGIVRDYTLLRDTAQLKDIEILRANAKRRTEAAQQTTSDEQTEKAVTAAAPTFKLPASLQVIEDKAFEGTALVTVEIPEKVEEIGERAFSAIPTLRKVSIPDKTTHIAKSAFAGSNHVTIIGAPGSYARKYAKENGIPFAPLTVICANTGADSGFSPAETRVSDEVLNTETDGGQSKNKPAGKTDGEIKAKINLNDVAYHITGRAPPTDA